MKMRSRHAVVLAGSLSQNTDERNTCEKSLKDLQSEGDYPVKICQVVLDTNELPAVRQLGSVVLKRFVQSHWLSASDKFEPPEIAESVLHKTWLCAVDLFQSDSCVIGESEAARDVAIRFKGASGGHSHRRSFSDWYCGAL